MEDSEKEPMESGQVDLPLNFATPLSARSGEPAEEVALPEEGALPEDSAVEEDLPSLEAVEEERRRMAEEHEQKAEGVRPAPVRIRTTLVAESPLAPANEPRNEVNPAAAMPPPRKPLTMAEVEPLPNRSVSPLVMPDGVAAGVYLRQVRESLNLTTGDLAERTKISTRYLEAIENDDIDRMPPAVYAIAYIRKLCDYYNISGESAEKMICELRSELNRDVPDALISRVEIDTESTEENERETRRLLWILGGCFGGFVILVILLGLWLLGGDASEPAEVPSVGESATVDGKVLQGLLPAAELPWVELPPR